MDWHLIVCPRNDLPRDQDVCDAASRRSVVPLSHWSVLNRPNSIEIPDFTTGSWESNPHNMDIEPTNGGGTTKITPVAPTVPDPEDELAQQWKHDHKEEPILGKVIARPCTNRTL